jgi:hypothetical protein
MSSNPKLLFDLLTNKDRYSLAGVGKETLREMKLSIGSPGYMKKLFKELNHLYGVLLKEYSLPMEEGEHPELDLSLELD